MFVKKLTAHRNIFSRNMSEPDGDGDYFTLPDWTYAFSIWGNRRSDRYDIRKYRAHFLRKEEKIISKRWHELKIDYNSEGVGVQVAPDLWENTYVVPTEQPIVNESGFDACTIGCNHCCCFDFGRVPVLRTEFDSLPKRRFHPFDDKCPWACKGGCSIYKIRPFACRVWHCKGVPPDGEKAYKQYLDQCHKNGAVVINSGVRGIACSEDGFYEDNWKLL